MFASPCATCPTETERSQIRGFGIIRRQYRSRDGWLRQAGGRRPRACAVGSRFKSLRARQRSKALGGEPFSSGRREFSLKPRPFPSSFLRDWLVFHLAEFSQRPKPYAVSVPERPDHCGHRKNSNQNGRNDENLRGRQLINKNDPQDQLTHEHTSPDGRNQAMAEAHITELPSGIESGLPYEIGPGNEVTAEIKHHRSRQEQGEKTGYTESAGEHGFADQQKTRIAAKEQRNSIGNDAEQNHNRDRIKLAAPYQIKNALAQGKKSSDHEGGKFRRRVVPFREFIQYYRHSRVQNDAPYNSAQRRPGSLSRG